MENYLEIYGLKWINLKGEETLWEAFNNHNEKLREERGILSDAEKVEYLTDEEGALVIEDKAKFFAHFKCDNLVSETPIELLQMVYIRLVLEDEEYDKNGEHCINENKMYAFADWQLEPLDELIENEGNMELKERYSPGFEMKVIFNRKETQNEMRIKLAGVLRYCQEIINGEIGQAVEDLSEGILFICSKPESVK